jgi:hypothetical protein
VSMRSSITVRELVRCSSRCASMLLAAALSLFPEAKSFQPCAAGISALELLLAIRDFGRKQRRWNRRSSSPTWCHSPLPSGHAWCAELDVCRFSKGVAILLKSNWRVQFKFPT